jgi:hypothetical protein
MYMYFSIQSNLFMLQFIDKLIYTWFYFNILNFPQKVMLNLLCFQQTYMCGLVYEIDHFVWIYMDNYQIHVQAMYMHVCCWKNSADCREFIELYMNRLR